MCGGLPHVTASPFTLRPCSHFHNQHPPQVIWSAVLGYAKSANIPAASFSAALPVLATIAHRRLAQLPPGFHKLWGLALLDQLPTPAGLELVAAAVAAGQDAAVDGASWQPGMLQWLRSAASAAAPGSIVAATAAVLRMADGGSAARTAAEACGSTSGSCGGSGSGADEDTPSLGRLPPHTDLWWHWWQEDVALSAQLAALIRGKLLLLPLGAAGRVLVGGGCMVRSAMPALLMLLPPAPS